MAVLAGLLDTQRDYAYNEVNIAMLAFAAVGRRGACRDQ
jgi:hypothetical protein